MRDGYAEYILLRQKLVAENLDLLTFCDSRDEDILDDLLDSNGDLAAFMWLRVSFLQDLESQLGIKDETRIRIILHVALKLQKPFSEFLCGFGIK